MTTPVSLLDEMDLAAEALRKVNPYVMRDDLQIEFRQIQKARMPELSREQWLELFGLWLERDLGRLKRDADAARQRILDFIAAAARTLPPGKPFVCICGAQGDPSDPNFERVHRPHVFLAGLDDPGHCKKHHRLGDAA